MLINQKTLWNGEMINEQNNKRRKKKDQKAVRNLKWRTCIQLKLRLVTIFYITGKSKEDHCVMMKDTLDKKIEKVVILSRPVSLPCSIMTYQ